MQPFDKGMWDENCLLVNWDALGRFRRVWSPVTTQWCVGITLSHIFETIFVFYCTFHLFCKVLSRAGHLILLPVKVVWFWRERTSAP